MRGRGRQYFLVCVRIHVVLHGYVRMCMYVCMCGLSLLCVRSGHDHAVFSRIVFLFLFSFLLFPCLHFFDLETSSSVCEFRAFTGALNRCLFRGAARDSLDAVAAPRTARHQSVSSLTHVHLPRLFKVRRLTPLSRRVKKCND